MLRFERAAFAAGIPMPEPVSASRDTLVHRWVEGQKMPGEILARIHALDVAWPHAIARFVDTCERPGPVMLTHRDIQPWNLLARQGRPVVLDWELSGMLDLSGELGSTALSPAKGPGFDDIKSVRDGVRGLPDLFGRLPELEAPLV